ncbi:MAG: tetratricopeptide repeat protein [Selenomonadaceae bacterium]|nr:tetratricopeptide repeat protein [Selenomonadaceae bacterium]
MNRPESSKFVPGLPADNDINTPTNSQGDNSTKIYDGVAECTMNESDNLKSVKLRAKDLAIQKVQQKISDYVYGFWKDRYLTLPDDEVLSIVNEICNITDVKYNVLDSDDKISVRATVLAQIDDKDIMNYIIQLFKEKNELKIQNEALRKENNNLKHQNDNIDLAINKFFEAENVQSHKEAIKLYSKAIQLYPNFAYAYSKRGLSYTSIGDDEKAKADYAKYRELRR